ncbi:glycosyltransferase family 4 protein [Alicyclobacillus tolerans]|uniref:glycosyltransferase family 4 protein n=1 Tax=Alicyclobacillus tolerans TaxID=90970 RepID=UPI001F391324|nr:glycosyltransferase family 4 protein [Alicyclobacillus tolerans]MCF8566048.1 glycosyltransferase family 4 protein [Alicyclobacillus tolerans]
MANVAVVAPEDLPIPPLSGGSVQIYLHSLMRALNNRTAPGHSRITLISPGKRPKRWLSAPHLHAVSVGGPASRYRDKVLHLLQDLRPEVVQIDNRPDFVFAVKRLLPKSKIVLNLHSTTFLGPQNISPVLARKALSIADVVVVNSRYLKRLIEQKHRMATASWNVRVIYPGVELDRFDKSHAGKNLSTGASRAPNPRSPFHILYVGRVIRQKGVDVLVDAIRQLHGRKIPVELTVVGKTPPWERNYAKKIRASAKNLPIRFKGFVSPQKLPQSYWQADVLVCPSQWREAFGLVNVEALAAGLPVIASRLGGIREIVDDTCGILVPSYRSARSFANAIEQLQSNPGLHEKLKQGAKKRAAEFTWHETARQFSKLYDDLSGSR